MKKYVPTFIAGMLAAALICGLCMSASALAMDEVSGDTRGNEDTSTIALISMAVTALGSVAATTLTAIVAGRNKIKLSKLEIAANKKLDAYKEFAETFACAPVWDKSENSEALKAKFYSSAYTIILLSDATEGKAVTDIIATIEGCKEQSMTARAKMLLDGVRGINKDLS